MSEDPQMAAELIGILSFFNNVNQSVLNMGTLNVLLTIRLYSSFLEQYFLSNPHCQIFCHSVGQEEYLCIHFCNWLKILKKLKLKN